MDSFEGILNDNMVAVSFVNVALTLHFQETILCAACRTFDFLFASILNCLDV